MDILNINEAPIVDESIQEYEFHEYEPVTGTNLNNSGEIRINIETQDLFTHPSQSYLIFEGQLTKSDGRTYVDADLATLTNNALMHLFSNIKYQLSGQEIESLFHPGQATTMFGLLTYPDDFGKSEGLNQCWLKDTTDSAAATNLGFKIRHDYIVKMSDPKGTFSFRVPLKHIFGFAEDYDKIVYGFKHTLTLVRKSDADGIFKANAADDGKVNFGKISWFMPHVLPADMQKMQLFKTIESKSSLVVGYRMRQCDSNAVNQSTNFTWRLSVKSSPEKPRYIIVSFQTDREGDQDKNASLFDHCDLTNMYIMLNSTRYPAVDYNVNFTKNQFSRLYGDASVFRNKYFRMDSLVSNPGIHPGDYKMLYPIFVFDVSKQSERLKNSVTDIQIKAQFAQNVPESTTAYALVISDRMLKFQSDGNKMSVVI